MTDLNRDIGKLEAKVEALEAGQAKILDKLEHLETTLSEAKGGWKVILLIAGASASIGALLSKLFPTLLK